MDELNDIDPEFISIGASSMELKLGIGILSGRPFGGVGIIWKISLADHIQFIDKII